MVGIVGTVGDVDGAEIDEHVRWSDAERERHYEDRVVSIAGTFHPDAGANQPVETTDGEALVWLLGEVYGFEGLPDDGRGHMPRTAMHDSPSYCAGLYMKHGIEFVEGLNGNFLGVIYDKAENTVYVFTDRLGSIPLFRARPGDGRLVFATNIQTVACHPAVETAFDPAYLHEFLAFKRAFGIRTPLEGIERHQPGAITAVDLDDGTVRTRSYWKPTYQPEDRPFEYFVDRFVETFREVMREWVHEDRSHGLLLSGGSDSRLLLAGFPAQADVTALHMSCWMSREARIAERVALAADVEFEWLRRHATYQEEALELNPRIANFNGWFSQAYPMGFERRIREEYDALLSGMYADTLFKGHALPSPEMDLGPLGKFELPIGGSIRSVEGYIDWLLEDASDELGLQTDLRTVLEDNIVEAGTGAIHHGVRYDSIEDMIQTAAWYPLTNDDDMMFRNSLHHLRPYRTPYLDNRFVDLALRMPRKYQLRRNIVNRALERLAPELAEVPHAHTGLAPSRRFPLEYVGALANTFWDKHVGPEEPPEPRLSNGPWVDDIALIRERDFPIETLRAHEPIIRELPFLDWSNVIECYERHLAGENLRVEIYGLLTLLAMPVTAELVGGRSAGDGSTSDTDTRLVNSGRANA